MAARALAGRLSRESIVAIHRELYRYAAIIAARLGAVNLSPFTEDASEAILESTTIIWEAARQLEERLLSNVGNYQSASFSQIQDIWLEAAEAAAIMAKRRGVVGVSMQAPPITLAATYESLGGAARTWKTVLPEYVHRGAQELDAIVRGSLMQSISPDILARKLRPYVQGVKEFEEIARGIPGLDLQDLRPLVRQALHDPRARTALNASRVMRHNSERIAFSEVYNARRSAEVLHYAADPGVKAVAWCLAPDRGDLIGADECDAFAMTDFHGLGPGIYPVDQVPSTPHPWCRCEEVPIVRPYAEFGQPKPLPDRQLSATRARLPKGVERKEAARIRDRVENLFSAGFPARMGLQQLAAASTGK